MIDVLMLVVVVMAAGAAWWVMDRGHPGKTGRSVQRRGRARRRVVRSVREVLSLSRIAGGGVLERSDGALIGMVGVQGRNYALLDGSERRALLGAASSFLMGVGWPVQVYTHYRRTRLDLVASRVRDRIGRLPEGLAVCGEEFAAYLEAYHDTAPPAPLDAIVLAVERDSGREDERAALDELNRRAGTVEAFLAQARGRAVSWGTDGALDALYGYWCPARSAAAPLRSFVRSVAPGRIARGREEARRAARLATEDRG